MTAAIIVVQVLILLVLIAIFGKLDELLRAFRELGVRLRDAKSEAFEEWMRGKSTGQ